MIRPEIIEQALWIVLAQRCESWAGSECWVQNKDDPESYTRGDGGTIIVGSTTIAVMFIEQMLKEVQMIANRY